MSGYLSRSAPSCDCQPWQTKHDEARKACEDSRFFEAVQLINDALEAFETYLKTAVLVIGRLETGLRSLPVGLLLTDPAAFVEEALENLPRERATELADLYATRADILMSLGGLRRADAELAAAARLAPEDARIPKLQKESQELREATEATSATQQEIAAQKKVPAHILTGFLGSGKTTLLNHILSDMHGKRLAVIENEFGEIGIDDALIATREELGDERIIEMNNGCICCTVRGDLIKGLRGILQRTATSGQRLDGVIIETTGLADPAPIAQTFFADDYIQARMVLDGIITVVDAKHALQHLREEKPQGVENEAVEQVAFADRIILNKTDLVETQDLVEVETEIRKINGFAPIMRTQNSRVPLDEIVGIRGFSLDRVLEADAEFLSDSQEHQHDSTVSSVGITCDGECELMKLNEWIGKLLKDRGTDIFRMKGVLAVKGVESRYVFQGIHMIFGGQPQGDWKEGEKRCNRLVFIGRNLNRAELERGFKATLAS